MLNAALEDRFRRALGDRARAERDASIRFAVDFAQLVVRILPDDVDSESVGAVAAALAVRTDLPPDEIDLLIRMAMAPENRREISDTEFAAFGARFGHASETALRQAVEDEVDLEGFAARYGPAESLLLLDSLFAICAVDGEIDPSEIGRLQQAARRLHVDPMLVGLLFRKHDLRHAQGDAVYDLSGKDEVLVGRLAPADIRLPDPQVAVRHARLERGPDGWRVEDLDSGRPTLVRGTPVRSAPLEPGDEVRVGPYRLALHADGQQLTAFGSQSASALSVRGITRTIPSAKGPITLLDDVSFTVFTGEVIALVGPSGAGKTTLLNAIAGIFPPDAGEVLFERADFHTMLASDRSLVGIVPQEDVVHGELTVQEALWYAGRLRFPGDVDADGVQSAVDRVLGELDIEHIRDHRIGTALQRGISGGQRKRVNLGQELLTRTTRVLFLDEPTSGLDPQTAQDIVRQVRQLADDGRIVFLVTHDVSPSILGLVDHLMVLAPGGRLAWFGPPREAVTYFGVDSVDAIFGRLPEQSPEAWRDAYRQATASRTYVRMREHLLGLDHPSPKGAARAIAGASPWRQLLTATRRYALAKIRDWTGTGILLAQAPLLAVAFALVFPEPQGGTLFVAILSSLWFGASAAVRELIVDRPIWRREARVGLRLGAYLGSKVLVLSALVTLQCLMLAEIMWFGIGMGADPYAFSMLGLAGVCVATGLVGMSLGLFLSSLFGSSEAAVGSLPLVLIPQIAFGGLLVLVKDMTALAKVISYTMITRYGFEAAIKTGERISRATGRGSTDEISVEGYLFTVGFRQTADAADMGLSIDLLAGLYVAFFVVTLAGATWLTDRARHGG